MPYEVLTDRLDAVKLKPMLFNSYPFIFVYLPIVWLGFFVISQRTKVGGIFYLGLASLAFYGYVNPKLVFLLLISICFNYAAALVIIRASRPLGQKLLVVSICANLLCLAAFKYLNFFITTANHFHANWPELDILLPVGISFFTFTQIAFLVDVYRGLAKETRFMHYLLFVTWFPHLIAGPVLHHSQMMPQFKAATTYRPNIESITVGITFFTIGLFKKVVLADEFALIANPLFDSAAAGGSPKLLAAWVGAICYALQLYFDFSGYCDMAIGLSRLFNIKLPLNFDSPYKSASIIDFWRRWHMTLSRFLRDYLYVPLGGNRRGVMRRYSNLMLTMILGGLWHGANWTFIVWGAMHGVYLLVNHMWRALWPIRDASGPQSALHNASRALGVVITFIAVVIAWVPFRADSIGTALSIWYGMLGLNGIALHPSLAAITPNFLQSVTVYEGFMPELRMTTVWVATWISLGLLIVWCLPNTQQWLARYGPAWDPIHSHVEMQRSAQLAWRPTRASGFYLGIVFAICLMLFNKNSPFLYYQF
jgi:alginate O-acetyltransferase complex protein AlgI